VVVTPSLARVASRTVVCGLILAVLAGAFGFALARARFGTTDEQSVAHIETELRERFDRAAQTLGAIGARVALSVDVIEAARRDDAALRSLFDVLATSLPQESEPSLGVTIYAHPESTPLAWWGRVSELPRERIDGPPALFVAPRARLIRLEPIVDTTRSGSARIGTIVIEQWLGEDGASIGRGDTVLLPTAIAPVTLRASVGLATGSPYSFLIPSTAGQVLMEATVNPSDLAAARARWAQGVRSIIWSIGGVTLLLLGGAVFAARTRFRDARGALLATLGLLALFAAARVAFQRAALPFSSSGSTLDPIELLLTSSFLSVIVWMLLDLVERRRVASPRLPLIREGAASLAGTSAIYLAAGFLGAALLWSYEALLQSTVAQSSVDLAHFSLHPLVANRLGLAFGLVLLHAAVIWSATLLLRTAAVTWRGVRSAAMRATAIASWAGGAALAILVAMRFAGSVPLVPLAAAIGTAGFLAWALAQPRGHARHASHATRLLALYLAILIPAAAMYPSLHAFAIEAKEQLVSGTLAPLAASQREDLRTRRMPRALEQIAEMPTLVDFVTSASEDEAPTTDRAFLVWKETELARYRLTSAVELYGASGRLVSRFARNLPEYEYAPAQFVARNCADWDLYEEISPFGSRERHVLRASRGICNRAKQPVGGVVVRAMFAYRDLPFLSSTETRYVDALAPDASGPDEGTPGHDVEFSVYGWSRAPIYASGTRVWPLSDQVFDRMVTARTPVWDTVRQGNDSFRVYYSNDRGGIYALGYPSVTPFGHVVNVAELVTLTFALYILILLVTAVINALTSSGPASGRALLREFRSSFYRKLFLFFVLASVVPVGILAFVTRAYFLAQLRAGVEQGAINTATIAQRLVEDYAALQQGSSRAFELLDDQIMILVGRAIDQDVDLFDGPRLQATSERDLYASGALSTRTPSEVFRDIAVDRRPTYAGIQTYGRAFYQLAAAPVRAGGREGIVTVPQTLRQVEIERQIDELNRQVVLGLVLFILLGAGIGYSMAERIADPVNRLTRATRRIARGDLDARVAATSSDELRRLVEDFNRMADDLKRQRSELERTQRLEAWADMARQVAHDIKNPLTPIQLSAEHAQRVNQDRGRPLSPALDECIASILTQVKLLRQIAAEFSSFASSPVAHPELTVLPALIDTVVEPYRAGLVGRVEIDVRSAANLPEVSVDRTLFARALTNVIENALHAMPGGGRLTVSTEPASDGPPVPTHVTVSVTDTGVGMDQDDLARIFEPYFSTRATGTGLGLTIAKRNVELNGGTIGVASERGKGTTVSITLSAGPAVPASTDRVSI
jgi:signal transduction histidine kinase